MAEIGLLANNTTGLHLMPHPVFVLVRNNFLSANFYVIARR